jgi:hypothetical protein
MRFCRASLWSGLVLLWAIAGCRPPVSSIKASPASVTAPLPFRLVDVAAAHGLDFQHRYGSRNPLTIVETMGSGCACFDYDNDGAVDVFLISAGDDYLKPHQTPGCKLYHNNGDGSFTDVTARSGIVIDGYAMGCCVGDYDNDGYDDLFVTGYGRNWLFHNRGDGTFEDVTARAGILHRPGAWGMGCAFVDVNRDGKLDLYVANYIRYDPHIPLCPSAHVMHGCTPNQYATQANELYINQGNGRFTEQAVALRADDPHGAGLGVVVCDFDGDGWPDIFVANDGTPNALLHNEHGHFHDMATEAGVAYSEEGTMRAGMGADAGDFDNDGRFDLVITNFQHEPTSLYHNEGNMNFRDVSYPSGIGTPSLNHLKFGVAFLDIDCDGKLDLYVGNGHVYDNVTAFDDSATFEQRDQIYLNQGGGKFKEILPESGAFPDVRSVTRSVAVADFNNDGAMDILINSLGRPVRLLENHPVRPYHWIGLKLKGTRCNRSAIGARVELHGPEGVQVREVRSGGSYLAQSDLRVLFNLSAAEISGPISLRIRWPDGQDQTIAAPIRDRYVTLLEPK